MKIRSFRALLGYFLKMPNNNNIIISISFAFLLGLLGLFARVCVKGCAFNKYGHEKYETN